MAHTKNKRFEIANSAIIALYGLFIVPPLLFSAIMMASKILTPQEVRIMAHGTWVILPTIAVLVLPAILLVKLSKKLNAFDGSEETTANVNKFLKQSKNTILVMVVFAHTIFGLGFAVDLFQAKTVIANLNNNHLVLNIFLLYAGFACEIDAMGLLTYLVDIEKPLYEIPYHGKYKTTSVRSRLLIASVTNIIGLIFSVSGLSLAIATAQDMLRIANAYIPTILLAGTSILVTVSINTSTIDT